MNDEDLLAQLGQLAKSQENAESEQWDALASGELDEEALAELEARAAHDPEVALRLQLFRPVDTDTKTRVLETLSGGLVSALDATPEQGSSRPARSAPVGLKSPPVKRGRRPSRWALAAVPLAVAAAVALLLSRPQSTVPLPDYSAELRGGQSEQRSGTTSNVVPRIGPSSQLELRLRPSVDVKGSVEARAFAVQAERVTPLDATPQIAPSGGVRLQGRAGAWFGAARGNAKIVVLIARPGALQDVPLETVRGEEAAQGIRRMVLPIELVDD